MSDETWNPVRDWRRRLELTQDEAAALLECTRRTITRYETGAEIPPDVLEKVGVMEAPRRAAKPDIDLPEGLAPIYRQPKEPLPERLRISRLEFRRGARNYDFSEAPDFTAGIPRLRASNLSFGPGMGHWDARPAKPGWQRIPGCIVICHESIPDPIPFRAPAWSGARGILTASGRVFDQETGHEMRGGAHSGPTGYAPGHMGNARAKVAPKAKRRA